MPSTFSTATVPPLFSLSPFLAELVIAECIYKKKWHAPASQRPNSGSGPPPSSTAVDPDAVGAALSEADDARLVFGAVYSLRNMVRKLGGTDDAFVSYRTGQYKLHYYETPTSLKFVMVTDTK